MSTSDDRYRSMKEYWSSPERDRRHGCGRRDSDFSVCAFHDKRESDDEKSKSCIHLQIQETRADAEAAVMKLKAEHEADIGAVHKRIDTTDGRVVGKWPFGIIIMIFIMAVGWINLSNHMLVSKMAKDIDELQDNVSIIMVKSGYEKAPKK